MVQQSGAAQDASGRAPLTLRPCRSRCNHRHVFRAEDAERGTALIAKGSIPRK
jgi:hypothetical protein